MDPTHRRSEGGNTLIELLVVFIILGVLSSIAIPVYIAQKDHARGAAAHSDLRYLVSAQEAYHERNGRYAHHRADLDLRDGAVQSPGVQTVVCGHPDEDRYLAAAYHPAGSPIIVYDSGYDLYVKVKHLGLGDPPCGAETPLQAASVDASNVEEDDVVGHWPPDDDPIIQEIESVARARGLQKKPTKTK